MRKNEAILLYALLKGYKINVCKISENSIMSYYRSRYKGLTLHLATITRLYILGGVNRDWEEEETCPRVSPLTLMGITKGPKNRSRETEIETEEEEWDNRENKKVLLESIAQEQQEMQRNLSPIWNVSLDVRETHQETAESSGQQSNNAELKEMLKQMRQEMQERDRQIKLQLQLRDEYLDKELRRKD